MSRGARGFTLLELIVVLAILGVVLAVAVPSLVSALRTDPRDRAVAAVTGALAAARRTAVRSGDKARAGLAEGGGGIEILRRGRARVRRHGRGGGERGRDRVLSDRSSPGAVVDPRSGRRALILVVSPLDGSIRWER